MSIFPDNAEELSKEIEGTLLEDELPIFKEYKIDFETNELILDEQGSNILVEKNDALKIWIWKVLQTNRYKYIIYSNSYGNELETIIGKGYSKELIDTEVQRYIEESLLANPYIKSVENIEVEFEGSKLKINVKAKSIYGEVEADV